MHSFAFGRYGGEFNCAQLALETKRRLEHFFRIYDESGDVKHVFSPEELESYPGDLEWCQWLSEQDEWSWIWERGQEIMKLVPTNFATEEEDE